MNASIAKGHWQRLKGALSALWGSLTGDRLQVVYGRHQQISGRLHIAYGVAQLQLERQMTSIRRRSAARRIT